MISFSPTPPNPSQAATLPIARVPTAGRITAVCTSHDIAGTPTHFYHNRTVPCQGDNCDPCNDGYSWRWHGYVSALDLETHEHFLFEMTPKASEAFTAYRASHKTLRGCKFQASRKGTKTNGRVIVRCKAADLVDLNLPSEPNVVAALCHIWNIPTPAAVLAGTTKGHPRVRIDTDQVDLTPRERDAQRIHEVLANMNTPPATKTSA